MSPFSSTPSSLLHASLRRTHLCRSQGKHDLAEPLYRLILAHYDGGGSDAGAGASTDLADALSNLACNLTAQGRLEEAEEAHRRALGLRLQLLGSHHPAVAQSRSNLARALRVSEQVRRVQGWQCLVGL